ncbi:MAG TPA: hypothetical protein VF546_01740 [Pyrinomonadaceae bacterium]
MASITLFIASFVMASVFSVSAPARNTVPPPAPPAEATATDTTDGVPPPTDDISAVD